MPKIVKGGVKVRADRLLEIVLLLQTQGQMTAADLARALAVSERTIYRDLDALGMAGIPVVVRGGVGGGCALPDHYRTSLTGVSPADIGAVLMASTLKPMADLGLEKKVQTALHKLIATLPATERQMATQNRQKLHLDPASWFRRAESVPFLAILQEAVWSEKLVELIYQRSDGTARERLFAPYGLVAKAGVWYVVGRAEEELRVYRVTRVQKAALLETPFTRPFDFDLASFWAEWCVKYEASMPRFTATLQITPALVETLTSGFAIPIVEVKVISDEAIENQIFEVTFETFESARSWILSGGAGVKVLAPNELYESILTEVKRIVALYPYNLSR
jgi:predicted DNA-binding transcriptional regulator YafY